MPPAARHTATGTAGIGIARGIDIEAFPAKLKLAMDRANLSRAALAQALAMDKSVVARWLLGAGRVSDHSLSILSTLLARHVPDFSRAHWDVALDEFADRLGLPPPKAAESSDPPPRPPTTDRPGSLARFLAEAAAAAGPDGPAGAAERFCGLWLLFWPNLNFEGEIGGIIGEIWQAPAAEGGGLETRWRNGASGPGQLGRRGPAFATGHMLFVVNCAPLRNHTLGAVCLLGTERQAAMMDGILMHPVGPRANQPMATRVVCLRLAGPEPDWEASERRFWAAGTLVETLNNDGWAAHFPEALRPAMTAPPGLTGGLTNDLPGVLLKPDDSPFLLAEQDLRARGAGPQRAAMRDAVLAMRALFAPALPPG